MAPVAGVSECVVCQAGTVSNALRTTCENCPAGHIAPSKGTSSCTACEPGYAPDHTSTSCAGCLLGYSSPSGEECLPCQRGAAGLPDKTGCQDCPPGFYGETEGELCMPGCSLLAVHFMPGAVVLCVWS